MTDKFLPENRNEDIIKVTQNKLIYAINKKARTADIIGNDHIIEDVYIPRSIIYEGQEYVIINIRKNSFTGLKIVRTIKFPLDSEIQSIEKEAFSDSSIEYILFPPNVTKICEKTFYKCSYLQSVEFPMNSKLQTIENFAFEQSSIKRIVLPSSVLNFDEKWCIETNKLIDIQIIENKEHNISCYQNEFILGKTDIKSDVFDIILFASRDMRTAVIPETIKKIASCAFYRSSIESVVLSEHVTEIGSYAFYFCERLQKIEIPENSKLQSIKAHAFYNSQIKSLMITSDVVELEDGWCDGLRKLNDIKVMPNNKKFVYLDDKFILEKTDLNSDIYDKLCFSRRDIKTAIIPKFIKSIGSQSFGESTVEKVTLSSDVTEICYAAFSYCKFLKLIEIPSNSQLRLIGNYSFIFTLIENICIPKSVVEIGEYAFFECSRLQKIEIPYDSELQIIGTNAFLNTSIESIFIPSHVKKICQKTFARCQNLKKIEFSPDSQLQIIEMKAFTNSSIEMLTIPSNVSELEDGWCYSLKNLVDIKFMPNNKKYIYFDDKFILTKTDSKKEEYDHLIFVRRDIKEITIPPFIKIIGSSSFSNSSVEKVFISSQVIKICNNAFSCCKQLQQIVIPPNSQLQIIEDLAFCESIIETIFIPSHVKKICKGTFKDCFFLKTVEIAPDSELQTIEAEAFVSTSIKKLTLPQSVSNFEKKWCEETLRLIDIEFMPNNKNFIYFDGKYILGKTDEKSEEYDLLVFARRNIKIAKIPDFIKTIGPFSFSRSSIEYVFISSSVTQICENAFFDCTKLRRIEIQFDSKLQKIEEQAFSFSSITSIYIPPHITDIFSSTFEYCRHLEIIEIEYGSKIQYFCQKIFKKYKNAIIMLPAKNKEKCLIPL